jgi:hypothetical protein
VVRQDRTRIELLVLASVFVILVLVLRWLLIPMYLLLSVLFSYYVTLGVTFVVFWALDPRGFSGIDWKVAMYRTLDALRAPLSQCMKTLYGCARKATSRTSGGCNAPSMRSCFWKMAR